MRLIEIEDTNDVLLREYKPAVDIAIKKYKDLGVIIFRGSRTYSRDTIKCVNPTTRDTDRKSSNSFNYYTLWLDNDPDWAEYPKRSKSLICSSSFTIANSYGSVVVVIPLTDCKIGICPEHDIWNGFGSLGNLDSITAWLNYRFKEKWPGQENENITYQQLIQKLKEISYENTPSFSSFESKLKKYSNAEEMFHALLDPDKNDFKLTSWKQFNIFRDTNSYGREVWLSAPCLLIPFSIFDQLMGEAYK